MTLRLSVEHLEAMRRHAEADYPQEACGLIGGVWDAGAEQKTALALVPVRNERRDSPHNRFLIDPEAFRRVQAKLEQDGLEVIGVYHSHPDHPARPSAYDREHAWPRLSYVIIEVRRGRAAAHASWLLTDDRGKFVEELVTSEGKVAWQSQF